jgi:hypothetical protein
MEPTKAGGENDPTTESSNAIKTDATGADNDSQQTLACGECDSTNIRRIQGDTGVGRHPTDDGPYACNDCGAHGEPVEREKRTDGNGQRGLAGRLADPEAELLTDGGEELAEAGADRRPSNDGGDLIPLRCESCDWLHYYRERVRGEDTKLKCPECHGGGVTRLVEADHRLADAEPPVIDGEGGAAGGVE